MAKKRKVKQFVPATVEGDGEISRASLAALREFVGGAGSHQMPAILDEGSQAEGEGRELKNLDADILVQVFSFLHQRSLLEVMSVSKYWEKTVMEGRELWKQVEVLQAWDLRGRGMMWGEITANQMVPWVLEIASKVSIPRYIKISKIMSVVGLERPQLRALNLPDKVVDVAMLTLLLSNYSQVEALRVGGELLGKELIHISHSKLQRLEFVCCSRLRSLKIHCPSLMHLSTDGNYECPSLERQTEDALESSSLYCPQLTKLRLPSLHSTPDVVKGMAGHAPNISWLSVYCQVAKPLDSVNRYKSLCTLILHNYREFESQTITQLPQSCRNLTLYGEGVARELDVCHQGLRSLLVMDFSVYVLPKLNCSALEVLTLRGPSSWNQCLELLHTSCPVLKKLTVEWPSPWVVLFEIGGDPLTFVHETLEELVMIRVTHTGMCI